MSLRDRSRLWLAEHRDQPLTLTEEQREMVTRAVSRLSTADLTHTMFGDPVEIIDEEHTWELTEEQIAELGTIYARGGIVHSGSAATADRIPDWLRLYGHHPYIWTGTSATITPDGEPSWDDALPRDAQPDACWRCNIPPRIRPVDPALGLCATCHTDLTTDKE